MGVERAAGVEQALGRAERFRRRDGQIVGDTLFPGRAVGEWAPERVPGPGVPRPASGITVTRARRTGRPPPAGLTGWARPAGVLWLGSWEGRACGGSRHRSGSGSASQ